MKHCSFIVERSERMKTYREILVAVYHQIYYTLDKLWRMQAEVSYCRCRYVVSLATAC